MARIFGRTRRITTRRKRRRKSFARETGAEFISPYNDPDVIAGAATIALELFEDAPGSVR